METDSLTQTLAIWGAVTGTIGTVAGIANLALRIKQHKKDQPKLVCTSDFSFEHSSGKANPKHKLIIRSVGKRPVTVDFIRYCIKPKGFWQSLFKKRVWKSKRWIYDDKPRKPMHITEGKKEETKITMPNGLEISDIVRVEVHDQSGFVWEVEWPSPKKLATLVHYEQLHETEESNDNRVCKLSGYTASGAYHIYTHWNPAPRSKSSFTGKFFHFKIKKEYDEKLTDIIENQQPKLLSCEIDDVT